ncbi:MAG: hypothetical protein AAGI51_00045 [Pseudomonadota bacterium]
MIPEFAGLLLLNERASPFGVSLQPALAQALAERMSPPSANVVPLPTRAASSGPERQSATPQELERHGIVRLHASPSTSDDGKRRMDFSE